MDDVAKHHDALNEASRSAPSAHRFQEERASRPKALAVVKEVIEYRHSNSRVEKIRRPYLADSRSNAVFPLESLYVDSCLSRKATGTQIKDLRDLAVWCEWKKIQKLKSDDSTGFSLWIPPETRLLKGKPPLLAREIASLAAAMRWTSAFLVCQRAELEAAGTPSRPLEFATVDGTTSDRRLRTIERYIHWLIDSVIEGGVTIKDRDYALAQLYKERLSEQIKVHLIGTPLSGGPLSLSVEDRRTLRKILDSNELFGDNSSGVRDKLIVRLLLEGLRAGELLCLKCSDFEFRTVLPDGRIRSFVHVVRRPNDPEDERVIPPSVKALPGRLAIGSELANGLHAYITGDRRTALNRRGEELETPYIFVTHRVDRAGYPISQRNLVRVVDRLKDRFGLPHEIWAHVMRHTSLTEIAETAFLENFSPTRTRNALLSRGRWSAESEQPQRYTAREITRQADELVDIRDRRLRGE